MSILDKVVAAVTPPETDKQRQKSRAKARAAAGADDWLSMVLQHHTQIDAAFEAIRSCADAASRRGSEKELAVLLTGHSNAEEAVLYPALVHIGEKAHATVAFTEHAGAKINLAELEYLDPMSQDYLDKLEHVSGAVRHHMYEEEGSRFLDLKHRVPAAEQAKLTERFKEEFDRYAGHDTPWVAARAGTVVRPDMSTSSATPPRSH